MKVEENNLLDAVYNGSIAQNNVADVYLMEASDMQRAYLMGLTAEMMRIHSTIHRSIFR